MKPIDDFQAEVDELSAVLAKLTPSEWDRTTQFKGYTIADVIRHLHQGDHMGLTSAERPDAFQALLAERKKRRETGVSPRDDARLEYGDLNGSALLDVWRRDATKLAGTLAKLGPDARLKWAGPDMGVKMFATARQMEVWAHGQEIVDILGLERTATDRLQNIAVIGVRTFGWTFVNRGEEPPGEPPAVVLEAPSGGNWTWNEGATSGRITGTALEFCQVVTQVRNIADTRLSVTGDGARRWMAIAQCFAGPPNDPPAPSTRFKVG